ncbi:MAG: hypothetical protein D6732_14925 [Methanobacteriota archaeon]|nr:MAG: hypothetical protein D6732_14925 [Euryarchaeota archaeon]
MVKFRVDHQEVMKLGRCWEGGNWEKIYLQNEEKHKEWVICYSYFELCMGYCNAAIHAQKWLRLPPGSFNNQHKQSIKLILTENYPILKNILDDDGGNICQEQ